MLGTAGALFAGVNLGLSIFLGGLTQWVPQTWFSYQAYRYTGASQADNILTSIYRGEVGKLMLTASGCMLTFVGFDDVNVLAFFGALIVMIIIQIILVAKAVS
jgi:ATP synthase protein I